MKATFLDLRRRMQEVLRALDRNETVTILYRGKRRAILQPINGGEAQTQKVSEHPAFGMWSGCEYMEDVEAYVRGVRQGRVRAG